MKGSGNNQSFWGYYGVYGYLCSEVRHISLMDFQGDGLLALVFITGLTLIYDSKKLPGRVTATPRYTTLAKLDESITQNCV